MHSRLRTREKKYIFWDEKEEEKLRVQINLFFFLDVASATEKKVHGRHKIGLSRHWPAGK
jgi:hypothetical protein